MTDDQIERGLGAFTDGQSGSWASCFFARAFDMDFSIMRMPIQPTEWIAAQLSLPNSRPVELVIHLFDNNNPFATKQDLQRFVSAARDQRHTTKAIEDLLASIPQRVLDSEPLMLCGV